MKKLILPLVAVALAVSATAQQYIVVNNEPPILVTDVRKITYEQDNQFESTLLPNVMAADASIKLFSEALQLTGLANTLKNYWKQEYDGSSLQPYYYKADSYSEVAEYVPTRYYYYTVFAETDAVYAEQGITNMVQLKAYAKQVYDEMFPEDASVSDPTDCHNSLNRFVAYHILPHGKSYLDLTGGLHDKRTASNFYDRDLTDISAWYATLMPQGSLKCSYPKEAEEEEDEAVYVNHRGLKDGPDKYGVQVRGAKIDIPENHTAFNGCYVYIDRILAYDQTVREQVLGGELWRVNCTTLSPDILNADTRKWKYVWDVSNNIPNTVFAWDIENFAATRVTEPLVVRRSHYDFCNYEGDDIRVFGDFDITIKLPPLPAGDWEVRLGQYRMDNAPKVNVYFNDELIYENYNLGLLYYQGIDARDMPSDFFDVVKNTMLVQTEGDDGIMYIEDRLTGERIISVNYQLVSGRNVIVSGTNPETGEGVDWSDRAAEYLNNYMATQPKKMRGPKDVLYRVYNNLYSLSNYCLRNVLWRLHSDGKTDNYLRLERCSPEDANVRTELDLDYLEFCPISICDNEEIPEE